MGPVVVPGSPDESRLITAIGYADKDLQMPPDEQLAGRGRGTADRVGAARSPLARDRRPNRRPGRRAVGRPGSNIGPPSRSARSRCRPCATRLGSPRPSTRFILARLEQNGLAPSPPADRRTLLRRATFDLIGLPPTLDEIAAFEADTSPDAFAKVVERLLASPHYGERWGRHWLDVARYADTKEYVRLKEERRLLFAFTYRDYVTRAFNADLPYNQFVVEQLAADLLPAGDDRRSLAALGFLTLGRNFTGNPHDIIDDRIDVTTRGLLGLTVTCARCHDHKFDPIPTADYYSLYGIFDSSEVPAVPPLIEPIPADPQLAAHQREIEAAESALREYQEPAHERLLHELRSNVGAYLAAAPRRTPAIFGAAALRAGRSAALRGRALVGLPGVRRAIAARRRWSPGGHWRPSVRKKILPLVPAQVLAELRSRDGSDPAAPPANSARPVGPRRRAAGVDGRRGSGLWRLAPRRLSATSRRDRAGQPDRQRQLRAGWVDRQRGPFRLATGRQSVLHLVERGSHRRPTGRRLRRRHLAKASPRRHTRPPSRKPSPPGRASAIDSRAILRSTAAAPKANAQTLGIRVAGRQPLVEQTRFALRQRTGTFSASAARFCCRWPLGDDQFLRRHRQWRKRIGRRRVGQCLPGRTFARRHPVDSPAAMPTPTIRSRPSCLGCCSDADSPTNVTPNDAIDFYLYESPVHDRVMALRSRLNELLAQSSSLARPGTRAGRAAGPLRSADLPARRSLAPRPGRSAAFSRGPCRRRSKTARRRHRPAGIGPRDRQPHQSAHGPGAGQPRLAAPFWHGPRRIAQQFRPARRSAVASRAAWITWPIASSAKAGRSNNCTAGSCSPAPGNNRVPTGQTPSPAIPKIGCCRG